VVHGDIWPGDEVIIAEKLSATANVGQSTAFSDVMRKFWAVIVGNINRYLFRCYGCASRLKIRSHSVTVGS
jgi:hypothetical protein